MLNEGLGGFILSPFQAVPSDYSRSKEKTTSIFALWGDDLNKAGVDARMSKLVGLGSILS
jgi:hypothetical protein